MTLSAVVFLSNTTLTLRELAECLEFVLLFLFHDRFFKYFNGIFIW